MTRRIYISADRFSISRPGFDVVTSPRTRDYMAIDSSFPKSERLFTAGIIVQVAAQNGPQVLYGQTFATPPAVDCYPVSGTTIYVQPVNIRPVAPHIYSNQYQVVMLRDRFRIVVTDLTSTSAWAQAPRDWIYTVWFPSA